MQNGGQLQSQVHAQAERQPAARAMQWEPTYLAASAGLHTAGVSPAWRKLMLKAEMAAPHVQVASIEGESGVGKETLAHYLLSRSSLAGAGFHRRDCREWLLTEGDLAVFSGFTYLDRVDLLGGPGQGLLLGVLKNLREKVHGRVMLVASSRSSLRQMAAQGQFLPDLAFRLTAVRFAIPPLRTRREDIPPLAQALLERICARYHHRAVTLSPAALGKLLKHSWPGNVRELASVLESALLEAAGEVIRPDDLALIATLPAGETATETVAPRPDSDLSLDNIIRRHVQYVLDLNRGNKLRAARQLHISRSTLYRILGNRSVLSR